MSNYFTAVKGGFSIHVEEDEFAGVRFCLARFGEDPDKVLDAFWRENNSSDFEIVPVFAYGSPPRPELCTARSLAAALQSVTLEPGSRTEQQWRQAAEALNVAWPKRLEPRKPNRAETDLNVSANRQ